MIKEFFWVPLLYLQAGDTGVARRDVGLIVMVYPLKTGERL
jgi:hypothetical protein